MIRDHHYLNSGYTPSKLPLSAMVQAPESCLTALPASKKLTREAVESNDENDRFAVNRMTGSGTGAQQVRSAGKVMAEVNTNRSFKVREAIDKSIPQKQARATSAIHTRPTTRSSKQPDIKPSTQKFTIFSDTETEAGTAPTQKWGWQPEVYTKSVLKKDRSPPLLPYEKDTYKNNWAKETVDNVEKKAWRSAVPKVEGIVVSLVQDKEEADLEMNDQIGLDNLDWEMDRMTLGKSQKRDSAEISDSSRRELVEEPTGRPRSTSHTTPVSTGPRISQRPLRTLEAIHDTLSQNCAADHRACNSSSPEDLESADIWVVRYMDYTSKYGLGFLLNNGCSGVYFNDSTKIILSADGLVFQYFERRHRNIASCTSEGDHMKTTYTLASHPPELVKKVTLLRHFRDYLIDRRTSDAPAVPEGKGNLVPANPVSLPAIAPGSTPWTIEARGSDLDRWSDMPYLKKWVRTRHAVLLRLSNRSVQVSFFDTR